MHEGFLIGGMDYFVHRVILLFGVHCENIVSACDD